MPTGSTAPDFLYLDPLLLACRLGHVRYEQQREALLAAARAAKDVMSYLYAVENFGVGRNSQLFTFLGQVLSAITYYRNKYPEVLGLRQQGGAPESFLDNIHVPDLVEPVLSPAQHKHFYEAYWWFSNHHHPTGFDAKKGRFIGIWSTEPKDNASVVPRFGEYLKNLINHKTQRVRSRFEGFPLDIVMALLQRSFL